MQKFALLASTASATTLRNPALQKSHQQQYETIHRVAREFGYHEARQAEDKMAILEKMAEHPEILPGNHITFVPTSLMQSQAAENSTAVSQFLGWYNQKPTAKYQEDMDYRICFTIQF